MSDTLVRGALPEWGIRFAICHSAELCTEAAQRHRADFVSGWLLGEALTCATLLSVNLKAAERYTLRWMYPGPVGTITVDVDERAHVRGYTQRVSLMPEVTTLAEAIGGQGQLSTVTSLPDKVVQTGITEAVFKDVPQDLAYFMSLSYQTETALTAGLIAPPDMPMHFQSAVGVLLQPFPDTDLERFDEVRRAVESPRFRAWLEARPRSSEEILAELPVDDVPEVYAETAPDYVCRCSRDKVAAVLRMLGPDELEEMLAEQGRAEVACHFCAEAYEFSRSDLEMFLRDTKVGRA